MALECLQNRNLEETRRLVLRRLEGLPVDVYLFGSWARGEAGRTSDIDIAILSDQPLPVRLLSELREELDESSVLIRWTSSNSAAPTRTSARAFCGRESDGPPERAGRQRNRREAPQPCRRSARLAEGHRETTALERF
jgi:predicted nucleotidyltransferase